MDDILYIYLILYFKWNSQNRAQRDFVLPAAAHASITPPAAGLHRSSVRARCLRPPLACPIAHVNHAAGQIHNSIIIYRLCVYRQSRMNTP